jgi:cytochrome P450
VRITPDEVHLSDPDNYEKIYYVGSKYPKERNYYGAMSCGDSSFTTMGNEEHRVKRSRLNPFFSKKKILELEDVIQLYAKKLCDMVGRKFEKGEEMDLHHGFRAVSVDVITDYALNKSYNLLESPDLGEEFANMWDGLGPTMWMFQQWPPVMTLANSMPEWMASAMSGPLKSMFQLQAVSEHRKIMSRAQTNKSEALQEGDCNCQGRYGIWKDIKSTRDHLPRPLDGR